MTSARIEALLRELVEAVASAPSDDGYFDQKTSPLGSRLHLRLVRSGELAGYQAGRRVLVLKADVHAWLERHRVAPTEPAVDADEELLACAGVRPRGKAA